MAKFDLAMSRCFSNKFLRARASWFYSCFNSQFGREQRAVLAGRNAYDQQQGIGQQSSALLRRNTHRIEKGLSMSPRRAVFAQDYIVETVACFNQCIECEQLCTDELNWAHDVLHHYFETVEQTVIVTQAQLSFEAAKSKYSARFGDADSGSDVTEAIKIPYQKHELQSSEVTAEQFHGLCQQRRSVRWFTSESVPDKLLNQAIETASLAPSACNRQPFQFYVANEQSMATKVAKLAGGTVGFADNIPCTLVVVGDLSAYALERDRHVIYLDGALASMQLMLALETLGLSTCPINWPDIEVPEQKMAKLLKLEAHQRPVMLIAVGYAKDSGMIPYSQKKTVTVLRKDIE
ncbi:nitroreductase family protein [Shewanella sp. UCD-KL12]|uniref:nitroreductase family protein n=1 Tax=Shewanella sp. UCD-KL12 TaxID=1917163 RepID=UPI00211646ED|nr:nitroreductase family protein [Shewanella sp. UCD-KL12]